ncbi:MAG: cysteine desulfurase family protein [Pirellulales bacterium]
MTTLRLPIYLDHHATTQVDPRVLEAMLPYFSQTFGNPGSTNHDFGRQALEAVERARESVAAALGAEPAEIVFTSGATESNNLAIQGVAERPRRKGNHLVSVATEHHAVLDPLAHLGRRGYEVTLLPVAPAGDRLAGCIDPQQVADALRDDTILVSVMLANNEIGALHPVAEIGRLCHEHGVLFHCDATQAVGKLPVDVDELSVDLLSLSAHKMYGPKGVGALYVRGKQPHVRLEPQILGGGQEEGRRSGTLNVPGIVGLAKALELSLELLPTEGQRLADLSNRLYAGLLAAIGDVRLHGPALDSGRRLPGNLNVGFPGVDGEALLLEMRDVAVSSGAACTSVSPEPSHVLRALGLDDDLVRASLRFGLGRGTTAEEIDFTIGAVVDAVERLKALGR